MFTKLTQKRLRFIMSFPYEYVKKVIKLSPHSHHLAINDTLFKISNSNKTGTSPWPYLKYFPPTCVPVRQRYFGVRQKYEKLY